MQVEEETRSELLTMPLRVWGRLASAADVEQVSVGDIIADAIVARLERRSAPPRPTAAPTPEGSEPVDLSDEGVRTRIRELHDQSWPGTEIARQLGVSYGRLLPVLHQIGLMPPRKTKHPVNVVKLRELHGQGLSDAKIAAALDVSQEAVRLKRNELKLPSAAKTGRPKTKTQPEPTKENHYS